MRSGEHRIRDDLSVEFTFDTAWRVMDVYWNPQPPRKLSPAELQRYRNARDTFLSQVSHQLGGAVAVVEL